MAASARWNGDTWLTRLLPFLRWWPLVDRHTLRADTIAGLTGSIVLVPQGVAFATIAGMPPEYGLYAAMVPAIVAALWGSSWHLVSGPTTAISIVVFGTISPLAPPGSAAYVQFVLTLTFLIGVFQLLLGALRLGSLINFVSHTVVVGFTAGAAVLIAGSQVKNFFGIPIERGASMAEVALGLVRHAGDINPYVTAVAVLTVLASVLTRRWWPRLPHMIGAMVAGSVVAALLNAVFGPERTQITSIGALSIGLPPLSAPDLTAGTLEKLVPIAIAVAMLALTEAVSIARAVALRSGQRIRGNQEFLGQGLSNVAGSFFSGYASSGSFNRSGLNYASGARTPLAAVLSAVFLLLIVLFLALLVASGINFVDLAGAQMLAQEARRRRAIGGALYIFHMKDEPLQMLRRCGAFDEIGSGNFFVLGDDVIGAIFKRLDRDVCATCQVRIFAPCKRAPAAVTKPN